MAITTTDVSLANRGLTRLGLKTIAGFTEDSDKARTSDLMYPGIRDSILSMHPWRFATGKTTLNRLVATPVNEWKYAYQLPTDLIAGPYAMFNSDQVGALPMTRFEIFEDKVYTDEEKVVVDYRYRPSEAKFPPLFQELVVYAFAAAVGQILTDNTKLATLYHEAAWGTASDNMRGGFFAVAARENAASNPAMAIEDRSLVDARFS